MKRYFIYIIMVVAALFVGCTTADVTDNNPQMSEVGDIEVTFSVEGEEVRALDLASVSHNIQVDVTLNNEGVYWTPVSDQAWCQIVEEEHRGNGHFTIIINANDSFDAREDATVTFKAGQFEQDMLTVTHNGNVFVLDQVYAASTKAAGSFTTKIKTRETGENWGFECDPWISATKGAVSIDAEGFTVTEVTVAWEENASASRYGEIKLKRNDKNYADGWINIWQYGTELEYDAEGNLLLEAQDVAPLELRVPKQTIKDIVMPSWVVCEQIENGDNTVSYMLQFAGNPSDANHIRTTELEISFLSGAASIKLPVIKQKYYAMEGLVSGPGLKLFAETWNSGGDVSQWNVDGVPTMLADIDLTEVTEWVSIGTAERPWNGEFNGNGKKIINLKSSQPLFGVCEAATLKNIVIDETSRFSVEGDYNGDMNLATIAADIRSTTIESCSNYSTISMDAAGKSASSNIYVASIVAKMDATSAVKLCTNFGTISLPTSCTTSSGSVFHVGGMAAYNEGVVEDCFNNGTILSSALVTTTYLGGIVGYNVEGATIRNSQNAGNITYGSPRGSEVCTGYFAGISGMGNGEISGNINEGDITSTSKAQYIYAGGITSYVADGAIILSNNNQANASDIKIGEGNLEVYAGGIIGYLADGVPLSFDFVGEETNLAGSIYAGNAEAQSTASISAGALVGFTESPLTINNAHYDGTITCDITNTTTGNYYSFGGLVGHATAHVTITSSTCAGKIDITPKSIPKTKLNFGGLVGLAEVGVTISDCSNSMDIKYSANSPSKSNGYPSHMGGIVGRILAGKSSIENCVNSGQLFNRLYNNNLYHDLAGESADGKMNMAAGILGSYGYLSSLTSNDTITIKDCTNANHVNAYRGGVAGIVGYIYNGLVDGCTYTTGNLSDSINRYAGGIAAIAYNSTVTNCTVTTTIKSTPQGSLYIRQGGIVAWARGNTKVSGCSYYGSLSYTDSAKDDFSGGIVGLAQDDEVVVENCRYGGTVNSIAITSNNCVQYAVGTATKGGWESNPTVTGIELWNGK